MGCAAVPSKSDDLVPPSARRLALARNAVGGNKLKAAETLKIGTSTLFRKLKQYQGAATATP